MIQTKAVKSTAVASLKGKWVWASIAALIPVFVAVVIYIIESVAFLVIGASLTVMLTLVLLILFPLILGTVRVFWKIANSEKQYVLDVFYYFSTLNEYKRAVSFSVMYVVPLFINALLMFLPSMFLMAISDGVIFESLRLSMPVLAIFFGYLGQLLGIIAFAVFVFKLLNYYMAVFLFTVNSDLTPLECIKKSRELAKFTKSIYGIHILSYTGWIALSVLVLPLVFTAPYMLMSYIVDCRFCVAYYNRLTEESGTAPIYRC